MADGGGGGAGYDPCECIFSHEAAMNRLLNLLRNTQSTCTDSECFTDGLPGPGTPEGNGWSSWLIVLIWFVVALALFFTRPTTLRRPALEKPPPGSDDRDGPPPPPPGPEVH